MTMYRDPSYRNLEKLRYLLLEQFARENCPCKLCDTRRMNCHAGCPKDEAYQKKLENYRAEVDEKINMQKGINKIRYGNFKRKEM